MDQATIRQLKEDRAEHQQRACNHTLQAQWHLDRIKEINKELGAFYVETKRLNKQDVRTEKILDGVK